MTSRLKQLSGDSRWKRRIQPDRPCPVCLVPAGRACRKPSGAWREPHKERRDA